MKRFLAVAVLVGIPVCLAAQRGNQQFPGGLNPDGSLRPSAPVGRLFSQDAYTAYEILEPGSEAFRITYLPETTRAGATELVNATRGGSEGSGVEVYDPRTGDPLKFVYEPSPNDPESHQIRATLPRPVPEGGIGRVLDLQDLQGRPDLHDERQEHRLGPQPERLPAGGDAPERVRLHVRRRRRADERHRRRTAQAVVRQPERTEQPGHDSRASDGRHVHAVAVRRHVLRRHQDALRPGRAGDRPDRRRADLQRIPQGRQGEARLARVPAAAGT